MLNFKLLTRTRELAVGFCERCSRVCNAACRRNAIVERARERLLPTGTRRSDTMLEPMVCCAPLAAPGLSDEEARRRRSCSRRWPTRRGCGS